jgi:iron(III) transport system substrate-binding protein
MARTWNSLVAGLGLAALLGSTIEAGAASQSEIAKLNGADRQRILEEGAKKEGAVAIYAALGVNEGLGPLLEAFGKKYPAVKPTYWRGSSREILNKVLVEKRGNGLVADVVEGGGMAMPTIKAGAAEAFFSPSLADQPKNLYDPDGLFAATRISYYGLVHNTRLISSAEAPKTNADLLDPKWQGKIVWRAGDESGALMFITNILSDMGDRKGEEYLQKLSAQKIINYGQSARAMVDQVGQGEYPIAVNVSLDLPVDAIASGAPIAVKLIEPVAGTNNTILLVKGAPHLHAAMLLIDFMLGAEGQTILAKGGFFVPHTKVEPSAAIRAVLPRTQNVKENVMAPAVVFDAREKAQALYEKYFN